MREIEIPLSTDVSMVESLVEECLEKNHLRVTMKGTLKKYPGCVHWHVKQDKQPGTLEITLDAIQNRAWFTVQNGRQGDWIMPMVDVLLTDLKYERVVQDFPGPP